MGLLDSVGDGLENLYKKGKRQVGKVVDENAHNVGAGLDFVGLHGAARSVDKFGDKVADDLGAQVGEMQLGDSDDPKDLVHGDVKAISGAADHLRTFHDAFESTGSGLRALDSDHWRGQAAEAFRAKFTPHPTQWLTAADACGAAATALDGFAQTVTWAQGQAKLAIDAYNAAKKTRQQAQDAYNKTVDSYNKAVFQWNNASRLSANPGPKPADPGEFKDPSTDQLAHAQDLLKGARATRDSAAKAAAQALKTATDSAPPMPDFTDRMKLDAVDVGEGGWDGAIHVYGGIFKGAAGIVDFGRGLNPWDPYNMTHPATYLDHVNGVAAGLIKMSNHPTQVVSSLIGSGWGSDPFEAAGKLLPNLALGAATDGAGDAATAAEDAGENTAVQAAQNTATDSGESAAQRTAEQAANRDPLAVATDPVDISKIDQPVWRTTNEPLYRMDNRSPDAIFDQGFRPRDPTGTDLGEYVKGQGYDSAFVGTSRDPKINLPRHYQYEVDAPGGIDVAQTLPDSKRNYEQEIAFPGGIRPENIKGAWQINSDGSRTWIANPRYQPTAHP